MTTTITSREFNQNRAKVKRAAEKGPVIITDRGKPAFLLQRIAEPRRSGGSTVSVADSLASDDTVELEHYIPKRTADRGRTSLPIQKHDDAKPGSAENKGRKFVSLYDAFAKPYPSDDIEFDIPEIRDYPKEIDFS